MRCLFVCRLYRTKYMVDIADQLKERGLLTKADAFVLYYDEWRKFLKNQSSVAFDEIFGTREIFNKIDKTEVTDNELERLERTYGDLDIGLTNFRFLEANLATHCVPRIMPKSYYSREDAMRYLVACFQTVESYFDQHHPQMVFDIAATSLARGAIALVAQKRGIPYIRAQHTLHEDYHCLTTTFNETYPELRQEYERLLQSKDPCPYGFEVLNQFRTTAQEGTYRHGCVKPPPMPMRRFLKEKARTLYRWGRGIPREIKMRRTMARNPELKYNFQLHKDWSSLQTKRMLFRTWQKVQEWFHPPYTGSEQMPEQYVFMTMHYQPEASTAVLAPFYVNQPAVIEMVARSLPIHWKLVVKPHPLMIQYVPQSTYRWIASIPNVVLADPDSNTKQLIIKSQAVYSISGTSALEATMLGKMAVVASDRPIWAMLKTITLCPDYTKLYQHWSKVAQYSHQDIQVAAYFEAIRNTCFSENDFNIWRTSIDKSDSQYTNFLSLFVDEVIQKYGESRERNQPAKKHSNPPRHDHEASI